LLPVRLYGKSNRAVPEIVLWVSSGLVLNWSKVVTRVQYGERERPGGLARSALRQAPGRSRSPDCTSACSMPSQWQVKREGCRRERNYCQPSMGWAAISSALRPPALILI